MAEGRKLTEEDHAIDSLETMKIDITQEKAAISHPTSTTIDTIPLEILNIIIKKSCILFIQRKNRAHGSEDEVLKQLASVSHCWFKIVSKRRFKNTVWSYMSSADRRNMEGQKDTLIELIESEFGLLDELLRSGALTRVKMAEVKSGRTVFEKNDYILRYIFSGNKHQELMKALSDCGQHHVVNWVRGNGEYKEEYGSDWPLRETEVKTLDNNQRALVNCLHASEILPILYSMREINERQRQSIDSEPTEYKKSEALLEIVRRFSLKSYSVFILCIRKSGQSHVANILETGGSIVPVHARLECEYLDEVETKIENQMENILMRNASMEQADRILAALQLKVIAMRRGQSIVVYISCSKEEEFDHLCKIVDNLEMRNILEQLFNILITNVKIKVLLAIILSKDMEKAKKEMKRKSMNTKDKDQGLEEERWKMTFDRHHDFIVDRMSPDFGLIDKLYSNYAITEDEKYEIEAERDVQKRNRSLIKCMGRKLELGKLIQVLRESDQKHLVNYLESDGNYRDEFDGEWPLTEKEISIIRSNYESLIDLIDMIGLLHHLFTKGLINIQQREFISSKSTSYKQSKALLEIVRRGSLRSYWQTIKCLYESNQSHIAAILEKGSVLTKTEVRDLHSRAKTHAYRLNDSSKCIYLYRNKPEEYFKNIFRETGGIMKVYDKDNSGDPASPINLRIKGLFFMATVEPGTEGVPLRSSAFGNVRLCIEAEEMLRLAPNLYFADYYCMTGKVHYVTLVMTKPGSETDHYCHSCLLALDVNSYANNPFFFRDKSGDLRTTRGYDLLVELLFTEDLDINKYRRSLTYTPIIGRGRSTPGGIAKNPYCTQCNVRRKSHFEQF